MKKTKIACLALASFLFIFSSPNVHAQTNNNHPSADIIKMGKQVFVTVCSACHRDSARVNAPAITLLAGMTPRSVLAALDNGKMRQQAQNLTEEQRKAVAQFITNTVLKETVIPNDVYTAFAISKNYSDSFDCSGWGGNLEGTGFRTAAQAGIDSSNVGSLKLKWSFAFPDATQVRCKPALINNWLIAGSQFGDVYAINTETGKPGWHFAADAAIRGAIAVTKNVNTITAYFADYNTNVYAINVKTGKLLWKTRSGYHAQSAVTGSVAVYNNMIFVPITSAEVISAKTPGYECCTSSGGLVALNASSGKILWQYKVIAKEAKPQGKKKTGGFFYGPSGAPVWCSPTVDAKRKLIYIGTGENYTAPATNTSDAIQAINMKTGKLVWNFQGTKSDTWNLACPTDPNCPDTVGPDLDFGMAPLLIHQGDGKDILVAGEKSGVVFALSTDGKLLWEKRIGKGGALGGIHWGMATDGKYVYAANADNIIALDMKDALVKPTPGLFALNITNGDVAWYAPSPACNVKGGCLRSNSAAPAIIPGVVFDGGLDGHIRAYSSSDGKILWDYNTLQEFETTDKVKGSGGALDGAAPVVANGMLFVNSGYGMFGELQGNVLLAFAVDKK
ncbi:MAG TPA: PQQ-binding-like beta-propeller repeat protein [Parafilimonas sp.]|nr:PQQ-binding-like beta-propeller repeat protein [Parafilimonas sp.]